jgi:hypothetical protein
MGKNVFAHPDWHPDLENLRVSFEDLQRGVDLEVAEGAGILTFHLQPLLQQVLLRLITNIGGLH